MCRAVCANSPTNQNLEHYVRASLAFLREEGGTRSVTEGARGTKEDLLPYQEEKGKVARAPPPDSVGSPLPEGAFGCANKTLILPDKSKFENEKHGGSKPPPYRFARTWCAINQNLSFPKRKKSPERGSFCCVSLCFAMLRVSRLTTRWACRRPSASNMELKLRKNNTA